MLVEKAKAEAEAARMLADAKDAVLLKTDLEIRRIQAEATRTAAEKWSGAMPQNILPQGSSLLFGLDQPAKK